MRGYIFGPDDILRSLIQTTAVLLLSSAITGTTAFSLNHEGIPRTRADISTDSSSSSSSSASVAVVTGVSPPLLDKAISIFDSPTSWPANSILNSGKILPSPEKFMPFKPFLPIQPFVGPPPPPLPNPEDHKDQGIYIPQPPEIPEPLQVTVVESPQHEMMEPKPPVEIIEPQVEVIEPISPEPGAPPPPPPGPAFFPMYFLWQQDSYPTSGPSQQVSVAVTGNVGDFTMTNNVNMQVVSMDSDGDHVKHVISPASSVEKLLLGEESESSQRKSEHKKPQKL